MSSDNPSTSTAAASVAFRNQHLTEDNFSQRRGPDNRIGAYRCYFRFADFLQHLDDSSVEELDWADLSAIEDTSTAICANLRRLTFTTWVSKFRDLARACLAQRWGSTTPSIHEVWIVKSLGRTLTRYCLAGSGEKQIRPYMDANEEVWRLVAKKTLHKNVDYTPDFFRNQKFEVIMRLESRIKLLHYLFSRRCIYTRAGPDRRRKSRLDTHLQVVTRREMERMAQVRSARALRHCKENSGLLRVLQLERMDLRWLVSP